MGISRSYFKILAITLGLGGWILYAVSHHSHELTLRESLESQALNNNLLQVVRNFRLKYQESVQEKEELKTAYKETLGKLTHEMGQLQQAMEKSEALNQELESENKMLVTDNTDLMDVNMLLGRQVQELEAAVVHLKQESHAWTLPWFGPPPSTTDKRTIVKLRDDKKKLEFKNKSLENEMESLYAKFQQKIQSLMAGQGQPAETLQADAKPGSIDLGTLSVSKENASFSGRRSDNPRAASGLVSDRPPEPRVVSVNSEQRFVIINLGSKNGITKGQSFVVRQDDREIARLHVTEIRDVLAACDIEYLKPEAPLKVNDPVFLPTPN